MKNILNILIFALLLSGCTHSGKKLPIIGHPIITGQDTLYSTIKPFTFLSQDRAAVTGKTFNNKIYVADFIFLSCTSICPIMTVELKTVMENNDILIKKIKKLRKEKNAVILAHYYQIPKIQEIAYFVGDSLGLSRKSVERKRLILSHLQGFT